MVYGDAAIGVCVVRGVMDVDDSRESGSFSAWQSFDCLGQRQSTRGSTSGGRWHGHWRLRGSSRAFPSGSSSASVVDAAESANMDPCAA